MKNLFECEAQDDKALAASAKEALERVCSGKALDLLPQYYSQEFVDHVNELKFQGREGARRSVESYTKVLSDLDVMVKEQLTDGDRVTSRFVVSGKSFGKTVHINGIKPNTRAHRCWPQRWWNCSPLDRNRKPGHRTVV